MRFSVYIFINVQYQRIQTDMFLQFSEKLTELKFKKYVQLDFVN